jgi:hypothetical protein
MGMVILLLDLGSHIDAENNREGGGEMRHLYYRRHILVSLFAGFVTTLIVTALLRVVCNLAGDVV